MVVLAIQYYRKIHAKRPLRDPYRPSMDCQCCLMSLYHSNSFHGVKLVLL